MAELHVDARGYQCPVSISTITRNLNQISPGETMEVLYDDKALKHELELWSWESGNEIIETVSRKDYFRISIIKGKGYKAHSIFEKFGYVLLGIRLHVKMYLLKIFSARRIKYLITFVSIPEGIRADNWLAEQKRQRYMTLPAPKDIKKHCGMVFGFKGKNEAKKIYNNLKENNFLVEDLYYIDSSKTERLTI